MTVGRTFGLVAALVLMAGCSVQEPAPATGTTPVSTSSAAPSPTPSSTPKPAPTTTASTKSAFCTDLQTFNVVTLHYRASVGRSMRGQALDFAELRRLATNADTLGKELLAIAPADIVGPMRTVLESVATSVTTLKPGTSVAKAVDPLFNQKVSPSWDTVQNYQPCR